MDLQKYSCFVGTARGVIIYDIQTKKNTQKGIQFQKPVIPSELTALAFGKEDEILIGYNNGIVSTVDTLQNKYTKSLKGLEGEGKVVGLNYLDKQIIAAKHDGIINLWKKKKNNYFDIKLEEKGTLETMNLHPTRQSVIGTGGEHNDLKLWDLQTFQCIFKAKSQGHNMLNLPIPTSVRSIAFLNDNDHLSICCTKEGQVLVYDEKAQRRPVVKFAEKLASYTTITSINRERQCLVGTTKGYLQLLDMRNGKCLKTFTTFTGSVTSVYCDPFEPYVFTTSLDRFFRVHHLETKALLHRIYLKQNLTKLLVRPLIKEEKEETIEPKAEEKDNTAADEEVDEEYEAIFRNMETVEDAPKRKRKSSEHGKQKKKKKEKLIIES